jgi:hypothetical protein
VSELTVFISHTTQDPRDFARAHEIAAGLRDLGAEVWIAPDSIPAGAEWQEELVRGLFEKCRYFLVLMTPASSKAEWVLREIQLARQRHDRGGVTILPIVVGAPDPSAALDFLRRFQAIPWRDECAEQLYLIARALGISAAPAPLTDASRASDFLEKEKHREQESVRPFRRIRTLAPLVGIAAYAPIALLLPGERMLAGVVLACGPVVTGVIGWGVTLRRIQQSDSICRRLDTMRDGLGLCNGAGSPSCKRLWAEFWNYAETNTRLVERTAP